jgi:hypothetical protein
MVGLWQEKGLKLTKKAAAAAQQEEEEQQQEGEEMSMTDAVLALSPNDWVAVPAACCSAAAEDAYGLVRLDRAGFVAGELTDAAVGQPPPSINDAPTLGAAVFSGEAILVPEAPVVQAGGIAVVLPATPNQHWFLAESVIMADVQLQEVKRRGPAPKKRRAVTFIVPMAVHDEIIDALGE